MLMITLNRIMKLHSQIGDHPTLGLGQYYESSSSSNRAVDSSNVGFKMLQKFGWKGSGLGKSEQGDGCDPDASEVVDHYHVRICLLVRNKSTD
jgi:hypothetical protein